MGTICTIKQGRTEAEWDKENTISVGFEVKIAANHDIKHVIDNIGDPTKVNYRVIKSDGALQRDETFTHTVSQSNVPDGHETCIYIEKKDGTGEEDEVCVSTTNAGMGCH